MVQRGEAGALGEALPGLPVEERAVAPAAPALLVRAVRVGAEQHAARLERRAQLREHPRQLLHRHVEQHCVGEDAVERGRRQREPEQVLRQHLAAARRARHGGELGQALEADRRVPQRLERAQVAPRAAAQVEYAKWRRAFDVPEQLGDVLADVVVPGALAELRRAPRVVGERAGADARERLGGQRHAG